MGKSILGLLNNFKRECVVIIFFSLVIVLLQAYFPFINKIIIDDIVVEKKYSLVTKVVLSIILVALLICSIDIGKRLLITFVTEHIQKNLKVYLLNELRKKSFEFQVNKNEGYLVSYFQSDILLVSSMYRDILPLVVQVFFQITISLIIIISVNVKILLMGTIIISLNVFITRMFSERIKAYSEKYQHENGEIQSYLTDTIKGSAEIISNNAKNWEVRRFEKLLFKPIISSMKLTKMTAFSLNINLCLYWISFAILTYYGLALVKNNEMSIGVLIATTTYFMSLLSPVLLLFELNTEYQRALGGWKRINELLSKNDAPLLGDSLKNHLSENIMSLTARNVTYKYPGSTNKVLERISFSAKKGELTLIKGVSGEGKSTLVNILAGFIRPSSGEIYLDEKNLMDLSDNQVRSRINVLFQEPHFFNESILDNLIFDNHIISNYKINEILRELNSYDFVTHYKSGIHTKLNGQFIKLSGGQKKRLALARILLNNPEILILDEPTAGLDRENEILLLNYLDRLKSEKIIVLISHSDKAEKFVDKIYELSQGYLTQINVQGEGSIAGSN